MTYRDLSEVRHELPSAFYLINKELLTQVLQNVKYAGVTIIITIIIFRQRLVVSKLI